MNTNGVAKSKGKAVSCILDGAENPMSQSPFKSSSGLRLLNKIKFINK